jgi:hypothetical protein
LASILARGLLRSIRHARSCRVHAAEKNREAQEVVPRGVSSAPRVAVGHVLQLAAQVIAVGER